MDQFQNLMSFSLVRNLQTPQISRKSIHNVSSYSANNQSGVQTSPPPTYGAGEHWPAELNRLNEKNTLTV